MIKSFKHKGLKVFFLTKNVRGINPEHAERLNRILGSIDRAKQIDDLKLPGYRLHSLKGDLKNLWSITVSGNWRITFEYKDGNAYILDYQDYH